MGCRSPVTVVSFLPPSKMVITNYLMDLFFCNFFYFFFNSWPQKLFVENTPSQNKNMPSQNKNMPSQKRFLPSQNKISR